MLLFVRQIWIGWLHLHCHDPWYYFIFEELNIKKKCWSIRINIIWDKKLNMTFSPTRERVFFFMNWFSRVDLFANINIWLKTHIAYDSYDAAAVSFNFMYNIVHESQMLFIFLNVRRI